MSEDRSEADFQLVRRDNHVEGIVEMVGDKVRDLWNLEDLYILRLPNAKSLHVVQESSTNGEYIYLVMWNIDPASERS